MLQELAQLAELLLTALNAPTQLFASHAMLDIMQALLEFALHAPPPTLLHALPPPPLPVLLVSTTLVLQQHPSAVDASSLLEVLQSPTALNAAQITRMFALLAQLFGVMLLILPPHVPPFQLPVLLSPTATLALQVLPHALNATQDMHQILVAPHASPLELLPTAFSTLIAVASPAAYATQVSF